MGKGFTDITKQQYDDGKFMLNFLAMRQWKVDLLLSS